jgi:hypothetical protein
MVVAVAGGVSVTGVLPGTAWRPEGTIAISGELGHLWRDQAGELADVLRLVVERMDACAQQRYAATGAAAVALLGEG